MTKKDKKKQGSAVELHQATKIIPWSYAEKIEQIIELKLTLEILKHHTNEQMTKTASYMFLATVMGYLLEKAPLFEERKLQPLQMEFYSILFAAACGGIYWYWKKDQIPDIIADGFDSLDVYDPTILDNRIKMLLSENEAQTAMRSLINAINLSSIGILLLIALFSAVEGKTSSTLCILLPLLFLHFFLNRNNVLKRVLYDENTINLTTVQGILTRQHQEIAALLVDIDKNNPYLKISIREGENDFGQEHPFSISLGDKRIYAIAQLYGKYRNLDIKYVNKELCYLFGLMNILSYPNFYAPRKRPGITIMATSAFSRKTPIIDKNSLAEILKQRLDFLCDVKSAEVSTPILLATMARRFKGDWHWSYINDEKHQLALCFSVLLDNPAERDKMEIFFDASCEVVCEDEAQGTIVCDDIHALIQLLHLNKKSPCQQTRFQISPSPRLSADIPVEPYLKPKLKVKAPACQPISMYSGKANAHLQPIPANLSVKDKDGIRVQKQYDPNRFFYLPNSALQDMDEALKNKKASAKMRLILDKGNCLPPGDRGTQGIKVYPTEKDGDKKFNLVLKPKAAFGSLRIWFSQHAIVKKDDAIKYEMAFHKITRK
ncbi:MAG: hypothetical protein K2Q33_08985 [Gammaproteobacteria bacterium]|nr:hypothetical protein [Gammaproteobacteria bacterium]